MIELASINICTKLIRTAIVSLHKGSGKWSKVREFVHGYRVATLKKSEKKQQQKIEEKNMQSH